MFTHTDLNTTFHIWVWAKMSWDECMLLSDLPNVPVEHPLYTLRKLQIYESFHCIQLFIEICHVLKRHFQ